MRTPKLQHIKMFDAAARHLNFRVAAEELNLTQGAVAQAVRTLEADLGIFLFERRARGLSFTEAGRRYHAETSKGLEIINEATRKLLPVINRVTISLPPSFASKWLVPRLPKFMESNPDIDVRIIASEHLTDFQTQDVDIAVRQGRRPPHRDLAIHLLAPMNLGAYCSPAVDLPSGAPPALTDLIGLPLIQDGHRYWEQLLPEHGAACPPPVLQFNQTSLALDAAANGQGVAIAPRLIARADVGTGRLREVWHDEIERDLGFWLLRPAGKAANQNASSALIAWILNEICA
ncbi:MAG: LysR substrate-binding domain-containing protein [Pseudomonadota bacterium]